MVEIAELTSRHTLKLPAEVAARFRPSDRFVIWVEGGHSTPQTCHASSGDEYRGPSFGRGAPVPGRDQQDRPQGSTSAMTFSSAVPPPPAPPMLCLVTVTSWT